MSPRVDLKSDRETEIDDLNERSEQCHCVTDHLFSADDSQELLVRIRKTIWTQKDKIWHHHVAQKVIYLSSCGLTDMSNKITSPLSLHALYLNVFVFSYKKLNWILITLIGVCHRCSLYLCRYVFYSCFLSCHTFSHSQQPKLNICTHPYVRHPSTYTIQTLIISEDTYCSAETQT